MQVVEVKVRWEGLAGATGYQVVKDGVVVGTRGPKARTTSLNVDDSTLVEIRALPSGTVVGTVDFSQVTA
jgi:hypothetical protein